MNGNRADASKVGHPPFEASWHTSEPWLNGPKTIEPRALVSPEGNAKLMYEELDGLICPDGKSPKKERLKLPPKGRADVLLTDEESIVPMGVRNEKAPNVSVVGL
jgi:hypothetical protein